MLVPCFDKCAWASAGLPAPIGVERVANGRTVSIRSTRWTALPDEFEHKRATVTPTIRAVRDSALLAGGQVRLYPMEGINGETVLLAYIAPARFVWATDHIQIVNARNILVDDVLETAKRHELSPVATSGPHFRIISWDSLP